MSIMSVEQVYREVLKVVDGARMSEGIMIDVKWGLGSYVGLVRSKCVSQEQGRRDLTESVR